LQTDVRVEETFDNAENPVGHTSLGTQHHTEDTAHGRDRPDDIHTARNHGVGQGKGYDTAYQTVVERIERLKTEEMREVLTLVHDWSL
jgi:hypothetical protein